MNLVTEAFLISMFLKLVGIQSCLIKGQTGVYLYYWVQQRKRSKISLKNLFNNDFVKMTGIRNGYNVSNSFDPFYIRSTNSEAQNNGVFNSVLEGLHRLGSQWTVNWNTSFGYTYGNQPDQRILTFRSDADVNANYYLRLSNENLPEIRNTGRVYFFWRNTFMWLMGMQANNLPYSTRFRSSSLER